VVPLIMVCLIIIFHLSLFGTFLLPLKFILFPLCACVLLPWVSICVKVFLFWFMVEGWIRTGIFGHFFFLKFLTSFLLVLYHIPCWS
jgi:hypothetical protein